MDGSEGLVGMKVDTGGSFGPQIGDMAFKTGVYLLPRQLDMSCCVFGVPGIWSAPLAIIPY